MLDVWVNAVLCTLQYLELCRATWALKDLPTLSVLLLASIDAQTKATACFG